MLCVQLVLRKQVYWLIHSIGLPDGLEQLTKDLWALRLQKVQSRVAYESETEAPASQVFSSQSESGATSASRSTRRSRRKGKERLQEGSPSLLETLAVCYVALLLLHIPVTVHDIHKWTNGGQLIYYRAARDIPLRMRERLPPRYQAQLEPQDLLRPCAIHRAAFELLMTFNTEFGMSPPRLNTPLVLYRWMRELMLPVEIYAASFRLAALLNVNFEFVFSTNAGRSSISRYPEARLMALVVTSAKLLFPFDNLERFAQSETDLTATRIDWTEWARQQRGMQKKSAPNGPALAFDKAFDFNENDCHTSSENQLDAYLDWYEDNIATEEIRERGKAAKDADFRRALFATFTTQRVTPRNPTVQNGVEQQASLDERLRQVHQKLQPGQIYTSATSDEEDPRPFGSSYRRFRKASELFGVAKSFYERAADLAGLSLAELVKVVFLTEREMEKLEQRIRKDQMK